jgi:hypothetical protein
LLRGARSVLADDDTPGFCSPGQCADEVLQAVEDRLRGIMDALAT